MRTRSFFRTLRKGRRPLVLGSLGSGDPISTEWGYDRGSPVDRWYIERFLQSHSADITGRVIEVKESLYTDRFGAGVSERAVLDVDAANEKVTHVADLAEGEALPSDSFDCFILTQTLQLIFDLPAALSHAHRILRPGGILLTTVPVTSRVVDPPLTDLWRFTPLVMSRLLGDAFPGGEAAVEGQGNLLSQVAFLNGLGVDDLTLDELERYDERFPLIVTARAVRAPSGS